MELGDLASVQKAKEENIPQLAKCVDDGWDLCGAGPVLCVDVSSGIAVVLMIPMSAKLRRHFDPFEYLMLRHGDGLLNTEFVQSLGSVVYHASCHQRVQNFGPKTRDLLKLIPDTEVTMIERCSGHDGTYGVKAETFDKAMKIDGL